VAVGALLCAGGVAALQTDTAALREWDETPRKAESRLG
jgi:hypothetical protein